MILQIRYTGDAAAGVVQNLSVMLDVQLYIQTLKQKFYSKKNTPRLRVP